MGVGVGLAYPKMHQLDPTLSVIAHESSRQAVPYATMAMAVALPGWD